MSVPRVSCLVLTVLALAGAALLAACGSNRTARNAHACMARAMYFESNRSSDEGMLAVGTVVMNRVESGKYPKSVCGVVGQKKQFAPGVLTKPMKEGQSRARAERIARAVLAGRRHRGVGKSMFFHTAGYDYPYRNMHYQVIAGGNAFYEKRTATAARPNRTQIEVAQATRRPRPRLSDTEVQLAEVHRTEPAQLPRAVPPEVSHEAPMSIEPPWVVEVASAAAPPVGEPLPGSRPEPLLAVAPPGPAPLSIEDLILASGG